jgi:microsomal prostaglandin-E synthase 2
MYRSNRTGFNFARLIASKMVQSKPLTRGIHLNLTGSKVNFKIILGLLTISAGSYYINKSKINAEEPVVANVTNSNEIPKVEEPNDDFRYILTENPLKEILAGKTKDEFDITLYQYHVCPFCCKVRAFLDYHKIPYKIVEVNPVTKSEIKFSDYKKVPVMICNGKQLNDSSVIISSLTEILDKADTATRDPSEVKWRKWVDHKFVHTIPPNIYRSVEEATAAFEYISDQNQFSWFQRMAGKYAGSVAMFAVSKRLKKRHNIDDEREAIYECARDWVKEVGDKPFRGGERPDLSDLAVYGVMSSIEGLPTFHDVIKNSNIGPWYERTKKIVGACSGVKKH